ncbi:hypothetical protein IU487_35070 [Nocardia puris]|uniref:hypothetical protein n=1 Tax=Nocardia puris TaxID=208602 RepID=UPI0018936435|nr:hypothetical protein [Nocardia puris]MBF6216219.1 hypothetical protein [Nocardia puris]
MTAQTNPLSSSTATLNEQRRVCRSGDCDNAPDDGDGWDGYCGNRADRLAADEFDD